MRQCRFTLVELMIVIAILGLLVTLAIPSLKRARWNAQNARFAADLRTATGAFEMYATEHDDYPEDTNPAVIPDGMAPYLAKMDWQGETSLGGQWDWDRGVFEVEAGVSVYQPSAPLEQLELLDQRIDDGDLSAGNFRQRSDGYIRIIEP